MTKSLLLLDNSLDIHSIVSNSSNLQNSKIISFDAKSNLILSELGIKHELMENYVDANDEEEIDNLSLKMALEWYKQKNFDFFLKL